MHDGDFTKFVNHYRALRLGSLDFEFVLLWRQKLAALDPNDLIPAVADVAADPRAGFPLNDLPLLIEHANFRRDERLRSSRKPKRWEMRPSSSEAWDRHMVEIGAIDGKEFKRRQAARSGGVA